MIDIVGDTELDRNIWLTGLLRQGTYEVTFTKIDGSTRTMPCTLQPDLLPPAPIRESTARPRAIRTETISAWATDIRQWRSFRVMNITGIRAL